MEPPELPMVIEDNFDVEQIRVSDRVPEVDKQRLLELLNRYKHCFASSLKDLGCTNATTMDIELNSQRPVVYRPYRLSHHEREKVRVMVKEMLDAGIVRESASEYASPIILVRKKDGSLRMCVDYRMLNSITVKERYPMPIIEDEIARLTGQACFISLDLTSGYYQVPISEHSKHLTSFVTPDGSARFGKATAYLDDVLIFGRDPTECLERLEEVLHLIEKANLTLNLSKCYFLRNTIDYLGYEISAAGVKPGEKKILCVTNFPRPENVHNVRQFLGLASYFRKFIKDFARIAFPLSKLLKKDTVWTWNDDQEKAFVKLKTRLVDRPILAIYDPAAETELHTDASRLGIGSILLQRTKGNDIFRPVAYYSRQTSPEEKNFHSYELETLAVVCSLRKFRVYLLGIPFKIVTDCSALRSTFSKRDFIPRIARWWLLLQEFQCSVEYRAGVKMGHVDALSRNPIVSAEEPLVENVSAVRSISSEDWLHTLQLGDTELCRIKSILSSNLDEKGLR
ncbi:jg14835 [Pararge aegeria aegeria]|uniref:RNA-directed DNA polymerase n=1 Tax=Pararge aegeria aegeria TaxID=348720 RepID=A0A8S4QTZ6_9NEOP|nr:jg14835 [Pararge aegeria aegeria]